MRQFTSGSNNEYVKLHEDGITVKVTIIKSTFNRPGGRYYVSVDDNFVKSRKYQEPLRGVRKRVWSFTTQIAEEEKSSDSITGRVRLTPEGSAYFESLNHVERELFYTELRQELANAIPVKLERITTNGNAETDISVSPKQILLSINIVKAETKQEKTVASVIGDLDTLIRNKPITVIASGNSSRYLNQEYGYKPFRKDSFFLKLLDKNLFLKRLSINIFELVT